MLIARALDVVMLAGILVETLPERRDVPGQVVLLHDRVRPDLFISDVDGQASLFVRPSHLRAALAYS